MKIRALVLSAAVVAATFSSVSFAQDKAPINIYGDCGLGGTLFPDNEAVAAITNVTWDLGTTALTSGTASPETCAGAQVAVAEFIIDTYANVEEDLSIGSGDHLTSMLSLAGCSEAMSGEVVGETQANFAEVLSSSSYNTMTAVEKSSALYNSLSAASQTTGACVI